VASKTRKKNKDQYLPNQKALFDVLARIRLRMIENNREVGNINGEPQIIPNLPSPDQAEIPLPVS
jgi:hypothetical protein